MRLINNRVDINSLSIVCSFFAFYAAISTEFQFTRSKMESFKVKKKTFAIKKTEAED